jgi:hypothetical protein
MVGNTIDDLGSVLGGVDMDSERACTEGHINDLQSFAAGVEFGNSLPKHGRGSLDQLLAEFPVSELIPAGRDP